MGQRKNERIGELVEAASVAVNAELPFDVILRAFEKELMKAALRHCRGHRGMVARLYGMHRNTVSRKIEEYRINVQHIRASLYLPPLPPEKKRVESVGDDGKITLEVAL